MKLRIRGNSLRLRLTKSEVQMIHKNEVVRESIRFSAHSCLIYSIASNSSAESISAIFDNNEVSISIPRSIAHNWASSDQISLHEKQTISPKETLTILIEKDFACLKQREGEDDSDAFPHPEG